MIVVSKVMLGFGLYHMAGKFGGELNLVLWGISANSKSTNIIMLFFLPRNREYVDDIILGT